MARGQLAEVFRQLRRTALLSDGAGLTDGQLLECYLTRQEEAAFEALVRRHGPMVLGVCRRVLRNDHDAEDAFQATFLVLIRKASSISPRDKVGNWLYGVAYRTSLKAKAMSAKRRAKERQLAEAPRTEAEESWQELQPLLDRELNRLPGKYREPIVLCDLEGMSRQQAAQQLGWPEGTVATRLATARRMLAQRLTRHGVLLSGGSLAVALSQNASSASVPTPLVLSTVKAAMAFATGQAAAAIMVSAKVAALTGAVLKGMLMSKVKIGMTVLLVLGVIGLGVGTGSYKLLADDKGDAKKAERKEPAVRATEKAADEENADDRLPTGEPPRQALISLVQSRRLLVKTQCTVYQPIAMVTPDGRKVTSYQLTDRMNVSEYNLTDIDVLENTDKGLRKVERDRLPKLLRGQILVLVNSGPNSFDPMHLRFIKDGTLILVLPYPSPVVPPPAVDAPQIPFFAPSSPSAPVLAPPAPMVPSPQDNEKGRRRSGQAAQPETRVGDIRIVGNEKTPDEVILKAIPFFPGEILSNAGLRKAEQNLQRLNLFERATITVLETHGNFKDVVVTVKEK